MHFSIRSFVLLSIIILNFVETHFAKTHRAADIEICPTFCYCDLFDGLNRANCSAHRLINPSIEVPPSVEILDLSDNDITILDNNCFQNFIFLKTLSIAHNAIHTIYLDTFSPMRSITSIDLSYNRLEYVDERIFETNRKLVQLNLSDNKFMSLRNKPLLRSISLRSLNLRNAQISHIYPELFDALPNLRELDVSANLMIALNMVAFRSLKRLQYLNLNANRWNCDAGLLNALKLLQKRGIQVELIDCNVVVGGDGVAAVAPIRKEVVMATTLTTKKNERFERLRMFDDGVVTNANFDNAKMNDNQESAEVEVAASAEFNVGINIANIWHRTSLDDIYGEGDVGMEDDQDNAEPNSDEILTHKLKCQTSCDELCFQYSRCLSDKVSMEKNIAGTYTINDLNFVFVMGIALGITFVVCIISCVMCAKRCCEARKKHEDIEYHISENAATHIARPLQPLQVVAPTPLIPPPRLRNSRRRRHAMPDAANNNHTNALVRRDYATSQGRDNFFARLFGRPARHQYYRTINQNTATLIRRLSRSNLFSNRLSQHFAAESRGEQHGRGENITDTPQTTPNAPSSPESDDERYYNELFLGTQEAVVVTPEEPAAVIEIRNRPETPPPSYGDVVVNVRKQ